MTKLEVRKSKDEIIRDFQKALLRNDYHLRSVFKVSNYTERMKQRKGE